MANTRDIDGDAERARHQWDGHHGRWAMSYTLTRSIAAASTHDAAVDIVIHRRLHNVWNDRVRLRLIRLRERGPVRLHETLWRYHDGMNSIEEDVHIERLGDDLTAIALQRVGMVIEEGSVSRADDDRDRS